MHPGRWLLPAPILLCLACGGGGGSSSPAPVPVASPSMLPPSVDPASGSLTIQWLAPSGSIDGFDLEARYGAEAFQKLNTSLLPAGTLTYALTLPASVAETTDCAFRAKARRGTESSPYSNEVTYHKPLLAAGQPAATYDWAQAGTVLSWSSPSTQANGFIVKRAECTNGGSLLGDWVTLQTVASTSTTWLDASARLGTFYLYRITNIKGAEASAEGLPSAVVSTQVPSPTQLVAVFDAAHGGVNLTWGSSFAYGDGLLIERATADAGGSASGWAALATPAAGAAAFLDTQVQEAQNYLYRISNVRGSVDSLPLTLSACVTVPPGTPSGLTASFNLNQGVPSLTWTSNSTRATAVRVERAEADASGLPATPWASLPVPAGVITSFTDPGAQEFTRYVYRVTNGFGATWGAASALSPSVVTPLAAPTQVVSTFDPASNKMKVAWVSNTTKADHVQVERAEADANGLPSSTWNSLTTYGTTTGYTDSNTSELTSYLYRVTNLASGVPSAASAPSAPTRTPLAPPSYLSAYVYSNGSVQLSWWVGNDCTYLLGRAEADASGTPTSAWSSLTVPAGRQYSLQDTSVTEGKAYVYRLAYSLNGYTTPYRQTTQPVQLPLSAPVQVQATPKVAGVDLAWVNKSTAATQIVIRRSDTQSTVDVASLQPGTTAYSDANLPLGTYAYRVVAKAGTVETASSEVKATTLNPPDALALTATTLSVLLADDAALTPSGTWAFAGQTPFGMLANPGDPWAAFYPDTTSQLNGSLVQTDASGHPHSVYLIPSTTVPTQTVVRHLWHDGSAWQTEDLWEGAIPRSYSVQSYHYTLDQAGRPQVLLNTSTSYYPTVGGMRHLHYTGSAWVCDSLAGAANSTLSISAFSLSLDAADQPHLLFLIGFDAVEFLPSGTGTWTSATLTTESVSAGSTPLVRGVWADADNGWLFYTTTPSGSYNKASLKVRQKLAGVWQAPQVLALDAAVYSPDSVTRICTTPSRSRVLAGMATYSGLKVYHQAMGAWHETLVNTPSVSVSWVRLGLDGAGHLHVLVPASGGTVTYADYHE